LRGFRRNNGDCNVAQRDLAEPHSGLRARARRNFTRDREHFTELNATDAGFPIAGALRLLDAGGARLADGTLIGVANYAGCAQRSEFAGQAAYGFCPSKSEWVWGVRLVLRADRRGLPLAYTLVPANEHEYEPLLDLVDAGEIVIADKGLWGRAYNQRMECDDVRLLTPARERTAANQAREHALAGTRLTIESVFANLKEQMRLERHLAKTPRGLAQRIAQRLLALTVGILLNTLAGRPARALAAYDGR
jgi:Transposase DDE domain